VKECDKVSTINDKVILVVGANGAFGTEFCSQLVAGGAKILGTARSAETSTRLSPTLEKGLILDLADTASIQTLANYLLAESGSIDGIVLASGLVAFGSVGETPVSVVENLMKVNATGQIALIQQLLPKLLESAAAGKEPFIVSISGVIAESPMAGLSAYSASKTALNGFATAATRELKKIGVRWLDARPGHTESGLATRAVFGTAPNFGAGKTVTEVVSRIIRAIQEDEKDLPSSEF
jgi:cyclic-di-GMP-binding biofilm dispersal mediator protein